MALIAALPEDLLGGGQLFRLNDRHGPGPADMVGLIVVLAGWLQFQRALWLRRRAMHPRWLAIVLVTLAVIATFACIAAFRADRDSWAFLAGAIAAAAQLALAVLGHCPPARQRD